MSVAAVVALIGAGTAAGVASTVAALASVVSYPALLALGLPPLSANVTNTVALVFTGAGAAAGSRPELAGQGRLVARLGALTALGSALFGPVRWAAVAPLAAGFLVGIAAYR